MLTLGEAWIVILKSTLTNGTIHEEYIENRNISMDFFIDDNDLILLNYANQENISEMKKVFFTTEKNKFNHSYKSLMKGPYLQNDLSDVIQLLQEKPSSNRAIVVFENTPTKQPCLNAITFSIRSGKLLISYFARGQDLYNKFYSDALCVAHMGEIVSSALGISKFIISAFIVSGHIYHEDMDQVKNLLELVE